MFSYINRGGRPILYINMYGRTHQLHKEHWKGTPVKHSYFRNVLFCFFLHNWSTEFVDFMDLCCFVFSEICVAIFSKLLLKSFIVTDLTVIRDWPQCKQLLCLTLYALFIILQYVYKPTRCTKFL